MGMWSDFLKSPAMGPSFGGAMGGILGTPFGATVPGAAVGAAIGAWFQDYQMGELPLRQLSPRTPQQEQLLRDREDALRSLLTTMPTEQERYDVSIGQLAGQASQVNQAMIGDAARRGLLHSGILAAEKAKMQRGLTEQAVQARLQAQRGETEDRAAILAAIAQNKPLPEVTMYQEPSSSAPMIGGLIGAGLGGAATQSPSGAMAGYQIGSAIGGSAAERGQQASRASTRVTPRWEDV